MNKLYIITLINIRGLNAKVIFMSRPQHDCKMMYITLPGDSIPTGGVPLLAGIVNYETAWVYT